MNEYEAQLQDIRNQIAQLQHMAGSLAEQETNTEQRLESLRNKNEDLSQIETTEHGTATLANALRDTCDLMNQHLDNLTRAATATNEYQ